MQINDFIQVSKPDHDSHFKLLPCLCGSDNVVYVQYQADETEFWRGQCFDCQRAGAGAAIKHDAQQIWNSMVREGLV